MINFKIRKSEEEQEDEGTIELHFRKNCEGDVEIVGSDGKNERILFVILREGRFARIPWSSLNGFRYDEFDKIEERENI